MVDLYVDQAAYATVVPQLTAVMVRPFDVHTDIDSIQLERCSAFLAGPGWGFVGREKWLRRLIESPLPGVFDADALAILAKISPPLNLGNNAVLTPHPGEAAALSGTTKDAVLERPVEAGLDLSAKYNAVVVLKSHVTTICEPGGRFWIVDGMNPALGTAGSGDVLAGTIAGCIASGTDPLSAARIGALVHSLAGRRAYKERGWFIAEDLLPYISLVFKEGR